MKRSIYLTLKTLTWIACLWPVARLVWGAFTNNLGPDPTATVTFSTGATTLNLLTLSLAVTPVRRLIPRLAWIGPWRKTLGLFAFFYATLHLATYVVLYAQFSLNAMLADVVKRRYITVGVLAWLLLLPLAATSTTWAIRKMGGQRWKQLHRLVYVAAILGLVHYWWQVKPGVLSPMSNTIILAALLLARPVLDLAKNQRRRAVALR